MTTSAPTLTPAAAMKTQSRYVAASLNGALLRTASYDGREYIVVPVIMLKGNVVVRPMNSDGPEFVPAEELSKGVAGWNGRPILPDHPIADDGTAVSANTPSILERYCFGQVFNAYIDNGDLKAEAWLDEVRAKKVGSDASRVCERLRANEQVEVSIGAHVLMEERPGTYDGKEYSFVWHSPVPDHLAMLPEGVLGACSYEMGCGAPRLLRAGERPRLLHASRKDVPMISSTVSAMRSLLHSIGMSSLAQEKGKSDSEIRQAIDRALYNSVPAYWGIVEVYPDSKTVIYMTGQYGENIQYWRRSYKAYADSLTLGDDAEEVKMDMVYTPAAAEAVRSDLVTKAACGCQIPPGDGQSDVHPAPSPTAAPTVTKEVHMDQYVKDAVGRLLAGGRFKEEQRATLESLTADQIKLLEEPAAPSPNPPTPAPQPTPTPVAEVELTEEQQIEALPATLREFALDLKARELKERNALIATLSAKQKVVTPAELAAKSLKDLRQLAQIVQGSEVDFSAAHLVPLTSDGKDVYRNPPKPWGVPGEASATGQVLAQSAKA